MGRTNCHREREEAVKFKEKEENSLRIAKEYFCRFKYESRD